jgi:thiamine kinase
MVKALPPTVQLKLEQVLSQWRAWQQPPLSQPQVQQRLGDGQSNFSVKVGDGEHSWVVRLDGFEPGLLGLSRSAELRAHRLAAQKLLAPEPVYNNPELGALVCVYCPPDSQTLAGTQELQELGKLLREIQQLPAIKLRLQPARRVQHYLRHLPQQRLSEEFTAACTRAQHYERSALMCHNDLLRANRVRSQGKLLALDWEYAACGDPWFEIAVIAEGDQLGESELEILITTWLQRAATEEEHQRLRDQRCIYREMARLWLLAYKTLATDSAR